MPFNSENREPLGPKPYNLDLPHDRQMIREFEEELSEYAERSVTVLKGTKDERVLKGIDLMFHEKGLFVFSDRYPIGAVRDLDGYRRYRMKWSALQKLWDRRSYKASMEPAMA